MPPRKPAKRGAQRKTVANKVETDTTMIPPASASTTRKVNYQEHYTVATSRRLALPSEKYSSSRMTPTDEEDMSDKENNTGSTIDKRKRVEEAPAQDIINGLSKTYAPNLSRAEKKRKTSSVSSTAITSKPNGTTKKPQKIGKPVNEAPAKPLDVFVFGDGACGELGLGSKTLDGVSPTEALSPRLNKLLSSEDVGVVQIACGGMHTIALTKDNTILTWGVNDLGALGRKTDAKEDEDDELNPAESTPGPVDTVDVGHDIKWTQVTASDNASFALTEDGRVYGWGTFRSDEGKMGFSSHASVQKTPTLLPDLKDIRQLAAGNNHILALDGKGKVFAWGCGEQHQLARRTFPAHPDHALRPLSIGALPVRGAKAVRVCCGSYHNFVIDQEGRVYAWGLNNYGELAIPDHAGEDGASQLKPQLVESLGRYRIVDIAGGEHHSVACTDNGELITWGRIDGHQVGLRTETFTPQNTIFDDRNEPRILKTPTVVPGLPVITLVASGTDHSFAVTIEGKVYSWGFGTSGRTGQGIEDDIEIPTLIRGKAVRNRKLVFAGAGGAFSILGSVADSTA